MAFFLFDTAKVDPDNLKFYQLTQRVFLIGWIGHFTSVPFFYWLGVPELFWFNLLFSVPIFTIGIFINRNGNHNIAFSLAFGELFIHQLLAMYCLGWVTGFQYWFIYLGVLSFFNPFWNNRTHFSLLMLAAIGFVIGLLFFQRPLYQLHPLITIISLIANGVGILVFISFLVEYFANSTVKAEDRLRQEKELTEKQRKELDEQHRSLIIEQHKTREMLNKVEGLFGQQVSQEIASEMIHSEKEINSRLVDASVMFVDIRDFTLFADSREPEEVARFQNLVFDAMIETVRKHKGVVLQILGDGILAVFGTPLQDKEHVKHAVNCGCEMITRIREMGERGDIPKIKIGIGLNSGKVLAGNVGNKHRKFYSLTGKNVIIASRIEQLNKEFDSEFLVTQSVVDQMNKENVEIEDLGESKLKGIEHPQRIYKLA